MRCEGTPAAARLRERLVQQLRVWLSACVRRVPGRLEAESAGAALLLCGSRLRLELVLEGTQLLLTVLLVGAPVLPRALGATVVSQLAAAPDVELPELLLGHRAGRGTALVAGAGSLLLLHHVPVGVIVPGHIQDGELLRYGVRGKLLNCKPI